MTLGQNHEMPSAPLSPTALQMDLEQTVTSRMGRRVPRSAPGPEVDRADIAKLTLADIAHKQKSLGTWNQKNPVAADGANPVMTAREPVKESDLDRAFRLRKDRVTKWAEESGLGVPKTDEECVAVEKVLTEGSEPIVLDAWRTFAKVGRRDADFVAAAKGFLTRHPESPRCAGYSKDDHDNDLVELSTALLNAVKSEVRAMDTASRELTTRHPDVVAQPETPTFQ